MGSFQRTLPDAATLQPEAQFPSAFSGTGVSLWPAFAVVAISSTYALHLTSAAAFLKTLKNLACFRDVDYPLSGLCQTICSKNFKDQVIGCSKGMIYWLAKRKSSV